MTFFLLLDSDFSGLLRRSVNIHHRHHCLIRCERLHMSSSHCNLLLTLSLYRAVKTTAFELTHRRDIMSTWVMPHPGQPTASEARVSTYRLPTFLTHLTLQTVDCRARLTSGASIMSDPLLPCMRRKRASIWARHTPKRH
jgi:hypothetical protein